uniref:Eukaryotic translation initiation factor 3 subunit F n=1 Tax=Chlamydomonas leiostraca TaxID=1034604 RepID=A0A7S0RJW6_9CHLO|mmetsp:Transcript_2501/g.6425  ORF Transcript_2501/g.6425 Transcript_2501/m.6425 type:complete len:290 (+) Transcript_2501:101-970(+)|eukprot:CAMPEP_0202868326 /NCGR_PEP_ID=MMETSP1391-20130828/10745_1 /ASSEMBLY_ACC=CAM_ASM_000867 /TAXON_ID=1034604 /ORGANISM="Chlamydomonas leiostraca, Strain SAG 11-49" /LENGTH=289 /DNA_ID=CAMNT_0049548475 /DNA_START=103 /DNA_END=972 /DNA_ORIENTATION=+
MTSTQVLLPTGTASVVVRVHPVALFSICDAYIRRNEKQERVIGTLLGTVVDGNVFEVKNCYVVPHTESSEQVALDIAHHKTMFELHQRVSPSEIVLGWFATGSVLYNSDSLIQEFYTKEAVFPNPLQQAIHVKVDTTLANQRFSITAYQSRVLALGDKPLATEFVELPCEVLFADVERVGASLLTSGTAARPLAEGDGLAASLARLESLLATAAAYVEDVVAGKKAGDPALGRYLADTLAVVPRFAKAEFERLFNDSVQDQLMVSYLANLLRAQVALAERLGTSQLPIM